MQDLSDDDIELDAEDLDRLDEVERSQIVSVPETSVIQRLAGENAILRTNLDKVTNEANLVRAQWLAQQQETKSMKHVELELLKQKVDQLETERSFLLNEVNDVSSMYRQAQSRSQRDAHKPVSSPFSTPKKKKHVQADLEASLRDGFDVSSPSPKRPTCTSPFAPAPPVLVTHHKNDTYLVVQVLLNANVPRFPDVRILDCLSKYTLSSTDPTPCSGLLEKSLFAGGPSGFVSTAISLLDAHLLLEVHQARAPLVCLVLLMISAALPIFYPATSPNPVTFEPLANALKDKLLRILDTITGEMSSSGDVSHMNQVRAITALTVFELVETVARNPSGSDEFAHLFFNEICVRLVPGSATRPLPSNLVARGLEAAACFLMRSGRPPIRVGASITESLARVLCTSAADPFPVLSPLYGVIVWGCDSDKLDRAVGEARATTTTTPDSCSLRLATVRVLCHGLNKQGFFDDPAPVMTALLTCLEDILETHKLDAQTTHCAVPVDPCVLDLVEHCVGLISGLWELHPHMQSILQRLPASTHHRNHVVLARIGFSDGGVFPTCVTLQARHVLEVCTTVQEADDIYNSMNAH